MSKFNRLILKLLSGNLDKNFEFDELVKILSQLDFSLELKEVIISLRNKVLMKLSTSNLWASMRNLTR
ncbi:hypothetical protein SAMN05444277_104173 [Parafilimonas terrae]|uniref:Uncharacterized protein n=1 Tax=Parafilimonas terrae TaxID=1465490 RepID=A0A1I5V2L8_9BACT|nr:hypothetical protein SAMN05444277_104173 [Parafilimonas terrae]